MKPDSLVEIYDQRYRGSYRSKLEGYEVARWRALEHFIPRVARLGRGGKVLDYGAGSGLHVELWERVFPQAELWFCDISPVAREKFEARHTHLQGRYRMVNDTGADFPDAGFDVVVSIEVLEHVGDLRAYLKDVLRLLRPGGSFVWTTPCANPFSIDHVYSVLGRKVQPTPEGYRRWSWEDPTHIRRLKTAELTPVLQEVGFHKVGYRFRAHLFSFIGTRWPWQRGRRYRERMMCLDYGLFRRLPNAASMIGVARRP